LIGGEMNLEKAIKS